MMIVLPLAQAASTALVRWAVLASGQRDRATARDPDKDLRPRPWVSLVPDQSHGPWNADAEGRGCRFRTAPMRTLTGEELLPCHTLFACSPRPPLLAG